MWKKHNLQEKVEFSKKKKSYYQKKTRNCPEKPGKLKYCRKDTPFQVEINSVTLNIMYVGLSRKRQKKNNLPRKTRIFENR